MQDFDMYCLSLHNEDLSKIQSLNYIPVGLGKNNFSKEWLRDNTGENISSKNNSYGEYSFHYWFWKNKINKMDNRKWVGFCAYRRFWSQNKNCIQLKYKNDFLNHIPNEWNDYSVILGQEIYMDGWSLMKILKHGIKSFISNPKYILKKNRNLKLHFDSFHGFGNLDKAISLLDEKEKYDFKKFMEENNSYNRGNMFILKSKAIINDYYNSIFPWLKRCEDIFSFKEKKYGTERIYAFLAERYLSYWFKKYTKYTIWPIIFYDINKNTFK